MALHIGALPFDFVMAEDFGGASVTVSHDDNGNLTDDGKLKNTYDAWNRLVKVQFTEAGAGPSKAKHCSSPATCWKCRPM